LILKKLLVSLIFCPLPPTGFLAALATRLGAKEEALLFLVVMEIFQSISSEKFRRFSNNNSDDQFFRAGTTVTT
jgi:hypothetical protein